MMFGFSDIPRPADTARENQTKYGLATLSRNPYFMCHYLKVRRKSSKRGSSKGRVMVFKGGNMVRAGTQLPTTTLGVFLSIKNMANQPWFTGTDHEIIIGAVSDSGSYKPTNPRGMRPV